MKIAVTLAIILLGLLVYIVFAIADLHTTVGWAEVTAAFLAFVLLVRLVLELRHNRGK